MNSSVKALSMLRRMAKPPSTSARMGFYLLGRIPTTFLGPRTLTPPSPSQRTLWFLGRVETQTFVSGFQPLSTPPVPHADASYGEHENLTGALNHRSLSRRIYQGADLIPVLHLGKPSGLLRRESRVNLPNSFSSSSGISLLSPNDLTQYCSFKIVLNRTSGTTFLSS